MKFSLGVAITALLVAVLILAGLLAHADNVDGRLRTLEITIWGPTRAPEMIDPDEEITGYDYDNIEVRVHLQPGIAPLVRDLFADGVLTNEEEGQIDSAFRELEHAERVERDLDEAKADLRKRLNPC